MFCGRLVISAHSGMHGLMGREYRRKNEDKLSCGPPCRRAYVVERDEVYQSGVITNVF